jgi:hypothetical protein
MGEQLMSSWMNSGHRKLQRMLACTVLILTGCATSNFDTTRPPDDLVPVDSIQVAAKFPATTLNANNLASVIRPCLPWLLSANGPGVARLTREIDESKSKFFAYGYSKSGNWFVISHEMGFCVQRSANNWPIMAAESLDDTAYLLGVPAHIRESWQAHIVRHLAIHGAATVVFPQSNGNAFIVRYALDAKDPRLSLRYTSTFKQRGQWEADRFDFRLQHPSSQGFMLVRRPSENNPQEHVKTSPLEHRFKVSAPSMRSPS